MLTCSHCKEELPESLFHSRPTCGRGYSYVCKPCKKKYRKELRERGEVKPGAEERFWSRVEKTDTCWLWRGGITTEGYGRFFHGGKDVPAHHMPMIFAGAEPPRYPMVCDHLCKVRNCVRWPEHIEVKTQSENTLFNSESVWAKNRRKTHCPQGHEYTPENTALQAKRHGSGRVGEGRICLTCHPTYWRHAIVPRERPPGSRVKRGDPDYQSPVVHR